MVCPAPDGRQIPRRRFAHLLPFQQVEIAANRRQRRTEVVGDVGNGVLQFPVALLAAAALLAQQAELAVQSRRKTAHGLIPAGDGEEGVGVGFQAFLQTAAKLLRRTAEELDFPEQE